MANRRLRPKNCSRRRIAPCNLNAKSSFIWIGIGERLIWALENVKNYSKDTPEQCRKCMVANGKAVKLFHKDNIGERAADMEKLHNLGVRFMACGNALAKNNIEKSDLFPVCEIVPGVFLN